MLQFRVSFAQCCRLRIPDDTVTAMISRGLASHLRVSERRSKGIRMRIAVSKEQKKEFLEPLVIPPRRQRRLRPDDPRRFLPVSAADSNQTTLVTYDRLLDKFINTLMRDGNKAMTRQLVEKAFVLMKHTQLRKLRSKSLEEQQNVDFSEIDPLRILHRAIRNCRPVLRLESIRRGGILYQVPVPVTENFSFFQAMRWIIETCREREGKADTRFVRVLANELIAAGVENSGKSPRHFLSNNFCVLMDLSKAPKAKDCSNEATGGDDVQEIECLFCGRADLQMALFKKHMLDAHGMVPDITKEDGDVLTWRRATDKPTLEA